MNRPEIKKDDKVRFRMSKSQVRRWQAYEKAMMELHNPKYGEQLKAKIKKANEQTSEIIYCWSCKKPTMHKPDPENDNFMRCQECLNYEM